jgi:hypothetical protein
MTNTTQAGDVYRRHSLLKRNPAHSREHFSHYYQHSHGPLAASLPGFRKFATRYIQNHVELLPNGEEPQFDGCTMSTQVPREDYTRGFFNEPDYEKVKPDEVYLFDLTKTVSVLGREARLIDGLPTRWKALILTQGASLNKVKFDAMAKLTLNHLDASTASALGFGAGTFDFDVLAEAWFEAETARSRAFTDFSALGQGIFLPVREVLIFGPEQPWKEIV